MVETFKDAALQFVSQTANISAAVATLADTGVPEAAIVYFYADEDLNFYFLTPVTTRKYRNLTANARVSIAVGGGTAYTTVQLMGEAVLLAKGSEAENLALAQLKNRLLDAGVTWPIYQLSEYDDDAIAVFKVIPTTLHFLNLEANEGLPVTSGGLEQII